MNNQSVRTSAKSTPGFIFYQSYYEALSQLKPRQRHAVLDAILEYAFTGVKPELPATSGAILSVILPNVESCQKRYKGAAEKAKKSADTAEDEPQENHEKNKASCENKSKAQKSEACKKPIIDKDKDKEKEKEKEKDMDKRVYTDKETESEAEAPQSGYRRTSPSGGNTHASQAEQAMKIISEYAGDDSELRSLLVSWLDIKEQRSQPINPESIRLNLEELTRITAGSDKKAYLREVIRRGWGTFFELERKPSKQEGGKEGKSGKNAGGAQGIKSGGYSMSDWNVDCESSFDIEEFDRFTLGI